MPALSHFPETLHPLLENSWQSLQQHIAPELVEGLDDQQCLSVLVGSDYVLDIVERMPDLVSALLQEKQLDACLDADCYQQYVRSRLSEVTDEESLGKALREMRHQQMVRIIWRDLTRKADYRETVHDLSLMADVLVNEALETLYQWECEQTATPTNKAGKAVRMVVLAMGKLGARELNLSSDIDLIFAYEDEGEMEFEQEVKTATGSKFKDKTLSHHQFFVRLGQKLIRALDQITAEGFVFRVDMRLRPWGKSGALAIGFDAMENYYEQQGREWERYAMIKARPIAGDMVAAERLMERLQPFIYRRYVDYGVFESLREMKGMIEREVRRKGMNADVKLGEGGIREAEFIVQAFQLIRGAQVPSLRQRNFLQVLHALMEEELLPYKVCKELEKAYVFLRDTEHRIQAVADRQTQKLPEDEVDLARLACTMGFADVVTFMQQLEQHRMHVRQHFSDVIVESGEGDTDQHDNGELLDCWLGAAESPQQILEQAGIYQAQEVCEALAGFREGRVIANLQSIGRARLDKLMPALLEEAGYQQQGLETVSRLLVFLEAIVRRSAYIALLLENPSALTQLVKLIAASPFIAEQLTRHPVLLDELLDVSTLYQPPARSELDDELRRFLLRIPEDDLEQQMEGLRNFKQAHLLRVTASEVTEQLPLMKVSDYLTWLAESIVQEVMGLAWEQLVEKHGRPSREDGSFCNPDFVVVGYGKLGGIELGHSSDLDIVFLHDASSTGMTEGSKSIANEQFFARLVQRFVHIMSTRTMSGQLYETDMRLRPSGDSGLLASSIKSFSRYQHEKAWTWEHQALVRARVVAGCHATAEKFNAVRKEVLCQPRDGKQLTEDVLAMRQKMIDHLGTPAGKDEFQIKHDPGGIVDIEFIVQHAVLLHACKYPMLTSYTDNIRILETLSELELMAAEDASTLREAYIAYRSASHRFSLENRKLVVGREEFSDLRNGVIEVWQKWFG